MAKPASRSRDRSRLTLTALNIDPPAPPPVMPANAGIHGFLCRNEDKAWIPAGACPRALDPWAGMTMGGAEESIICVVGINTAAYTRCPPSMWISDPEM
jgi:hypothetical protein